MDTVAIILLALLPILLGISALCSASETALLSLTQADRLRLRKNHPRIEEAVATLLADPRSLLVAILLANVVVNTAYFTVAGLAGQRLFEGPAGAAVSAGSVVLIILFGEVLPKALASAHRVLLCRVLALPLLVWFGLITPVRVGLARLVIAPLARLFSSRESTGEANQVTPEELASLVELAAAQGAIHEDEEPLLADVLQLSSLRVKDIMTPRVDVEWLDATHTSQELLQAVRETGYTRYPVCRGGFDERQVVGLVSARAVLPALARQGANARVPLPSLVQPPRFVPERARVDQLLELFRSTRSDMALVVDEAGHLSGMVQIDNVVAELVRFAGAEGESADDQVRMVALGEWEVPGRLSIHDWQAFFEPGTRQVRPSARVSTVGGLFLSRLGRVPRVGDTIDIGNLRLRVDTMAGRTVERVRVSLAAHATGAEPEARADDGAVAGKREASS